MKAVENITMDEERALYGEEGIVVNHCRFDGPADGESALKECKNVDVNDSFFNLRYPFWHVTGLKISNCELTELCRAALWYTKNADISGTKMHGIKALRECGNIKVRDCNVVSPEFGWFTDNVEMQNTDVTGEYFMMRSSRLDFAGVTLHGKYSFQYITDSVFDNCVFETKDAFWHAKNVTVKNSVVKGEYLAWYCENVTFENCKISGTQPLCYCEGLRLINCEMEGADFAFEKSDVEATVTTPVISIKNPASGCITVPSVGEIIMDDPHAMGKISVVK